MAVARQRVKPPVNQGLTIGDDRPVQTAWLAFFDAVSARLAELNGLAGSPSYASDAAAAAGGVRVNGLYRNGSVLQVRVT
jgi:hypothetical protein